MDSPRPLTWDDIMTPEYYQLLRDAVWYRCQNKQDFEDRLHDTIILLLEDKRPYDSSKASYKTWFMRRVKWAVIDVFRKGQRRQSYKSKSPRWDIQRWKTAHPVNGHQRTAITHGDCLYDTSVNLNMPDHSTEDRDEAAACLDCLSENMIAFANLRFKGIRFQDALDASGLTYYKQRGEFYQLVIRKAS